MFRENRTEKISKSSIQIFRRELIPLLGRDNFKFNNTPIEIETSITIISPLVEHPVSDFQTNSLNHVTCESQDTTYSPNGFRQHDFVMAEDRKSMMNGQLTHFRSLRIVKMEPFSVLKYHAKMAFMQLKKKHLNEFQHRLYMRKISL